MSAMTRGFRGTCRLWCFGSWAAGLLMPSTPYAQHVDPAPRAHRQDLTFARHVNTGFNAMTPARALQHGSRILERCDGIVTTDQDVACGVSFQPAGALRTFGAHGDGLDVITSAAERDRVLGDRTAYVKVVTAILFCSGPGSNIAGCSPVGGSSIAIISGLGDNFAGEAVVHELGHNKGLRHRGDAGEPPVIGNPIMHPIGGGRDEINLAECAAYHGGGSDNGLNAPVDFPPDITCPLNFLVECSSTGGTPTSDPQLAPLFSLVAADDGCEPAPLVSDNAPSFLPLGATQIAFTATDSTNNSRQCISHLAVGDSRHPSVACPSDITVECSAAGGSPASDPQLAPFFSAITATDACDPNPSIVNNAPPLFPPGVTPVTFVARDRSGNASGCSARVHVIDTRPPTIDVGLSQDVLWPPNHELIDVFATASVVDVCEAVPSFRLVSITSDEIDEGRGDGRSTGDIQDAEMGTADTHFRLRAERSGRESGRIYTIRYRGLDGSGNATDTTVQVRVPHNP